MVISRDETMNLDHARTIAARPVEDSDDANQLRLLVFELCDALQESRDTLSS